MQIQHKIHDGIILYTIVRKAAKIIAVSCKSYEYDVNDLLTSECHCIMYSEYINLGTILPVRILPVTCYLEDFCFINKIRK